MRWIFLAVLLLCGCTPLQQKFQKEQADQVNYNAQARERAAADKCNQASLPGTTQHLTCMLGQSNAAPAR